MTELNPETEEVTQDPAVIVDAVDERVPNVPDPDADVVLDGLMADDTIESESDDEPADATTTAEGDTTEDWDALVSVLRRDNVPMAVIEATDEDTLREWVNKAQKRQTDVDAYGGRLKDLEDRIDQAGETSTDEGDVDGDDAQPEQSEAQSIPEALADVIGDEAAQAIAQMIEEKHQTAAEAAQQAAAESQLVAKIMAADSRVRPSYGDKAPEADAVIAEMDRLGREYPNTYANVDDMLAEAYRNLAGEVPPSKRRKSQPTPTSNQPRRKPKTSVDAEDVALDALMSGGSREDARRAISR
jgi:hypothetical protein